MSRDQIQQSAWMIRLAAIVLALGAFGAPVTAAPDPTQHHGPHHHRDPAGSRLQAVTTIPDYAWAAREIAGDRIDVEAISRGDQDAHFVRPKPSYQVRLRDADLFVTTGLDLELWVPTLLDAAGNRRVLEGASGYVAAWPGVELLEKPVSLSRSEGDVHIYGNPHIHTDPLNMVIISRNILAGLEKIDPDNAALYREHQAELEDRLHRRLFGDELVELLGGDTLARLARSGKLWEFLESKEYPRGSGRMLVDRLAGWLEQAEPLRGRKLIGYHKNWAYLANRFGLSLVGFVEPKPGIPPTPRHVEEIIKLIRDQGIRVILAANYFDPGKPRAIAERTGARVVTVPLYSGGEAGIENYEQLIDSWIGRLVAAFRVEDG